MTLRNKIFVLIGMALTAILIVGGLGINSSLRLADGIDEIGVVRLPSVLGLEMMSEGRSALQAANLSVFSYADAETASAALSRVDAQRKDIWRRIGRGWSIYEPLPQTPEEKVLWDRFVGEWKTWEQNDRRIGILVAALAKAPTAEERLPLMEEYRRLMGVDASLFAVSGKTLDAVVSLNVDIADAVVREKQADARRSYLLTSTMTMLSLVILAVGAGMITRSILRQVGGEPSVAVAIAEKIAAGDLTVHVPLRAGDSASMMAAMMNIQQGLLKIVSELRSGTQAIASASNEIAAGSLELSSRTEEQASTLEETAASMEELTATVNRNADSARQASHAALLASTTAGEGEKVVSQVVETMNSIDASARKIVEITAVIDGIAFQTNILALNAAVEAARAGEQGRGFAVVASEVRNLSHRCAGAARQIKTLIDESADRVKAGTELAEQAGKTMVEVLASVQHVAGLVQDITAASSEQASSLQQITAAISQMDEATQQNASLVEESAAGSESLRHEAAKLDRVAGRFNIMSSEVHPRTHSPQAVLSMTRAS